jgi:radical SAM superfamily enzyme YgiQ (UPF0313 family)
VDLNIIFYHRYHYKRLFDNANVVEFRNVDKIIDDPWDIVPIVANEWEKPKLLEYFSCEFDEIVNELIKAHPKIVGFSTNGSNLKVTRMIAKRLKEECEDIIILAGGYDCLFFDVGPRVFPEYDYMIIGEAELTLAPLVRSLIEGKRPKNMRGVVSKYDSPNRTWKDAPLLQDIDIIDFPKYDWMDIKIYQTINGDSNVPIVANRGCRWSKCRFCAECFPWRGRNPKRVVDEIEWFVEHEFCSFQFNDSDFNSDPDAVLKICDEIIKRRLNISLSGGLRVHKRGTREFFERLKQAGFNHLRFGVDAWSKNTIRLQNKGYTVDMINSNLKNCHDAGIYTTVNLVIGVPGETDNDIKETINNIIENKNNFDMMENIHTLILAYGNEYYKNPKRYNIHIKGDIREIFERSPRKIPDHLWYSTKPYIDQKVRVDRLETIYEALNNAGVKLGSYAKWKVEDIAESLNEES